MVTGVPDAESMWVSLSAQAQASGKTGDMQGVIELFRERIDQKNMPNDHIRQVGVIIHNMADVVKRQGDIRAAIAGYDEAARYYRLADDSALLQAAIGEHVDALMAVGDYQRAMPLAAERASICRDTGNQEALLNCLAVQGKLLHWAGDAEHAAEVAEQQQQLATEIGSDAAVALSLANRGLLLIVENDLDGAQSLLEQAESILRRGTNRQQLANTIGSRAVVLMQKGDLVESLTLQSEAADICREVEDKEGLAKALTMQALLLVQLGQPDAAASLAIEADELARSLGLIAMAEEVIKPVLAMCGSAVSAAGPHAAATQVAGAGGAPSLQATPPASIDLDRLAERLTGELNYSRDLEEWKALPWLKRMRTPKPQPPSL